MKKLLLIVLLLCNNAFAQKQTVVVPFGPGSSTDLQCRHVMEKYDTLYNTSSVIINMPGAEQSIGFNHFVSLREPGLLCAGNGLMGIIQKQNSNLVMDSSLIRPVSIISTYSLMIYSTHGNSLSEIMKESKKSGVKLLVGSISTSAAKIFTSILDDNNVEYTVIPFRKPTDSLPVLKDKQLDIYVDGGSLKPMLDTMSEVKEIAYIGIKGVSNSENLYSYNDNIKYLIPRGVIYANSRISDSEAYELNRRFNEILKSKDTIDFMKSRYPTHNVTPITMKDLDSYTNKVKHYINHVYN